MHTVHEIIEEEFLRCLLRVGVHEQLHDGRLPARARGVYLVDGDAILGLVAPDPHLLAALAQDVLEHLLAA